MPPETSTLSTKRVRAGNVLIYLLGSLLTVMAIAKLAQVPQLASQLGAIGFAGSKLLLVGVLEAISALLFMVPFTRSVGLLLLSAFLGGAIAAHIGHGEAPSQAVFMIAMIWLAAWLRHPEILWSFSGSGFAAGRFAVRSN
jgi:DoxX-like family